MGQTYDYRKHQGHGAGVADEGAYASGDEHHEQKELKLAVSRELEDTRADHLGQPRLKDRSPHDKKPYHHYDHLAGESGESLLRSQYLEDEKADESTESHNVGPELSGHEKSRGNGEYN